IDADDACAVQGVGRLEVIIRVEEQRHASASIASAPADLLVIAIHCLGNTDVNHAPYVWLVNAEAKRGGCNYKIYRGTRLSSRDQVASRQAFDHTYPIPCSTIPGNDTHAPVAILLQASRPTIRVIYSTCV